MKTVLRTHNDSSVYPGQFMPIHNREEIHQQLKHTKVTEKVLSKTILKEFPDSYKLELSVPGLRREDFLLFTEERILSVSVLHKKNEPTAQNGFLPPEDCSKCFEEMIALPPNADTEFITAEYRTGILSLHIPKTDKIPWNKHSNIVVY